jgi:hypothetical protein
MPLIPFQLHFDNESKKTDDFWKADSLRPGLGYHDIKFQLNIMLVWSSQIQRDGYGI